MYNTLGITSFAILYDETFCKLDALGVTFMKLFYVYEQIS